MFYSFIEEKPLDFPSGNLWEHEWVWVELPLTWRGRGGGTTMAGRTPPWAASHSPIKGGWGLSLLHTLVPPPFSPPAAPFHGRSLGEALSVGFFTTPRRRAAGVPGDPLLPLPRRIEGTGVFIELDVWPITEAPPVCGAHLLRLEIGVSTTTPTTRFHLVTLRVFESYINIYSTLKILMRGNETQLV